MTGNQAKRFCGFIDNLFWALVWFAWLFPADVLRVLAVCLAVLMILVHAVCRRWRIAWDPRLQPVLVLASWAVCFAANQGAVPRSLSFLAVLAFLLLILDRLGTKPKRTR